MIAWNLDNYAQHGYGMWIVETHDGEFVGECGRTWQVLNGRAFLEVGYHILAALQGRSYATEAAAACRDFAHTNTDVDQLVAIIHPDNQPSRRVAKKIGMRHLEDECDGDVPVRRMLGMRLRTDPT